MKQKTQKKRNRSELEEKRCMGQQVSEQHASCDHMQAAAQEPRVSQADVDSMNSLN